MDNFLFLSSFLSLSLSLSLRGLTTLAHRAKQILMPNWYGFHCNRTYVTGGITLAGVMSHLCQSNWSMKSRSSSQVHKARGRVSRGPFLCNRDV